MSSTGVINLSGLAGGGWGIRVKPLVISTAHAWNAISQVRNQLFYGFLTTVQAIPNSTKPTKVNPNRKGSIPKKKRDKGKTRIKYQVLEQDLPFFPPQDMKNIDKEPKRQEVRQQG